MLATDVSHKDNFAIDKDAYEYEMLDDTAPAYSINKNRYKTTDFHWSVTEIGESVCQSSIFKIFSDLLRISPFQGLGKDNQPRYFIQFRKKRIYKQE